MSVEQMNRLGLLQRDPPVPVTYNLDISIPSPSVSPSSSSSTSYPSPTPSLPTSQQQSIQLQATTILLHPITDSNTLKLYPQQLVQHTPSSLQLSHRPLAQRTERTTPWRPW